MLRHRILFVLGILVIAAMVLTACPAAAPAASRQRAARQPPARQPPRPKASASLVWMVRTEPNENNWEQNVIAPAWAAEHPDIKLNIQILDQADIAVKREAMIAAGEPLHVWSPNWGGDGFASDRQRGLLTDLTPLIERDKLDMSVFIPEVLKIYQSEGKTYGLPFLTTARYIFYNMDLFDEADVPYPTTDWEDKSWTWDAMVDTAKKLTTNYDDPTSAQYGLVFDRQNVEVPPMVFGQFPWPEDAYATGFADHITLATPEINQLLPEAPRPDLRGQGATGCRGQPGPHPAWRGVPEHQSGDVRDRRLGLVATRARQSRVGRRLLLGRRPNALGNA